MIPHLYWILARFRALTTPSLVLVRAVARLTACAWTVATLAVLANTVRAQTPNPADLIPPSYLPKSPTAGGLARFDAQQLVNLPTGAAQLSVALGEVKCGALQLPVSLGYSYTGLQVGQPYDLVGLGWALQAGSTITRQVNGLIDDEVTGNSVRRYQPDSLLNPTQSYLKRATQNDVDTGPDVYSFALPNGSAGRFVIRDTTPVLLPRQPLQVRHLGSRSTVGFAGFQITTEDGVRYQFWARELTRPDPKNFGPVGAHASAWQLTHVISADNQDTLRLHYTSGGLEALPQQATLTTGSYFTGRYAEEGSVGNRGEDCGSDADYSFHNVWMFPSRVQAQYLDSITGRGAHLQLIRVANHQVQRVRLVATTNGRREIRRWEFFQSAFAGGTTTDYRLRLDSLQESAGGMRLPAYRFQYFNDVAMPGRGSAAKDYWGYYNGATGNGSNTTTGNPTLLDDPHLAECGKVRANRKPNYGSAQAGALLKVVYPTGGSTQWEYEPGRIANEDAPIPLSGFEVEMGTGYNSATSQIYDGTRLTLSGKAVFQVPEEVDVTVELSRTPTGPLAGGGNNKYRDFNIWRRLPTRDTLITNERGLNKYKCFDPYETATFTFHLVPGTYAAQVYCEQREVGSGIVIKVPYHDSTLVQNGLPGPGVRVRRATATAPGAPPLVHTYTYALQRYSSGVSLLPSNGTGFEEVGYTKHYWTNNSTWLRATTCHFTNTSSDNRGLGSEFNKYDFYYNAVKDELGTGQGATLHRFTHLAQQFNDVVPTAKIIYRQNPQRPERLQMAEQTRYTYATDSTISFPLIRVQEAKVYYGTGTPVPPTVYGYQLYEVRAGFAAPELTEQYQYDENGKALVTLTRATYQRQRLVRSATRTSSGWAIQRYKYLTDYVSSAAVQSLRGAGFNPVVETQTWRRPGHEADSVLVGGRLTFFDAARRAPAGAWSLRLSRPALQPNAETQLDRRFVSFKSDTRYHLEDSVRYDAATGLLQQRQPPKAPPTAYVWGYDRSQVVAQVENATYAAVAAVLSPATIARLQSANPGSDAQVRQLLAPLRTQLPQARVTIYTHAPLVGLTSQTDPSGRTSYYEYDDLGRLLRVRDEQGRILSEQEYHYARPN